ncbi:MAG: hypothetical protein L6Q26_04285 [Anaerolineales bacterium]|nr:hypothetical protein [Anaerolineales bacterium]
MNMQKLETLPPPPGVLDSLRAGFEVVSNRIMLILMPLGLDLLLWLGPRLSVDGLLSPYFRLAFEQARRTVAEADMERFIQAQSLLAGWLRDFNLLSLLSKSQLFPIGVWSLSAQTLPVKNPLGLSDVVTVSSFWIALGLAFALVPLGWVIGGVYYRLVAGSILGGDEARIGFLRAVVQSVILSLLWLAGMGAVGVPLFMVIGLFMAISPAMANIVLFILLLFSFWLIVPLFFTPHGIFVRGQNAFLSILSSVRMMRFSLPTSGMFVLSVFLLSYGLDLLWSAPGGESWLALVGFAGHAFMTTVLLAASFVYYRNMTDWMKKMHG